MSDETPEDMQWLTQKQLLEKILKSQDNVLRGMTEILGELTRQTILLGKIEASLREIASGVGEPEP